MVEWGAVRYISKAAQPSIHSSWKVTSVPVLKRLQFFPLCSSVGQMALIPTQSFEQQFTKHHVRYDVRSDVRTSTDFNTVLMVWGMPQSEVLVVRGTFL